MSQALFIVLYTSIAYYCSIDDWLGCGAQLAVTRPSSCVGYGLVDETEPALSPHLVSFLVFSALTELLVPFSKVC